MELQLKRLISEPIYLLRYAYIHMIYKLYGLDKLHQDPKALFAGKSVAIIGNASSIFEHQHGDKIDNHDIVVRMNKGFIKEPQSQGHRTDILALACALSNKLVRTNFDPELILWTSPRRRRLTLTSKKLLKKLIFVDKTFWEHEAKKHTGTWRPSCGFITINYILKLGEVDQVDLYGFDFGKSSTFYNQEGYQTPHNYNYEEEYISNLLEQGKVRLNP